MTDRIELTGLRARGHHGVFDFERAQGQDFLVDVVLELDLGPAARSDEVTDTVHYGELAEALVAIVGGEPVNLIETLAERLAARLPRRPPGRRRHGHRAQAAGADPARVRRRGRHPDPAEVTGDPGGALTRQQSR